MKKIFLIVILLFTNSCLSEWLDIKPDKKMVLISTLNDIRALLDNTEILNGGDPHLGEAGSDNFILSEAAWNSLSNFEQKNAAIWAPDIFQGNNNLCWENSFQKIFYSNLALEKINDLTEKERLSTEGKNIEGTALFFRAWSYFNLAQIFCDQYSEDTKDKLGLPIRMESDMGIPSKRSSIQSTYDLILSDLTKAIDLLNEDQDVKTRPSKTAAYGLLAKVYLQMGQYENALVAAENSLKIKNTIVDYNKSDTLETYPFERFNEEVIFHCTLRTTGLFSTANLNVDPLLLDSYVVGDLRKPLFYVKRPSGIIGFKGSYNGNNTFFSGLSVNEIVLIAAECCIRLNKVAKSLEYYNALLTKRIRADTFIPVSSTDKQEILLMIIEERRKELLFRGIRWHDLKRLKNEYNITLVRNIGEKTFSLPVNDKKWILPFPENVIALSGMEQNER